jgi:hypothetical protein
LKAVATLSGAQRSACKAWRWTKFPGDRPKILAEHRIGAMGKTEFPYDLRPEYKTHFGNSPEKRAYIETRILTSVAGTIAQDLRFAGRAHDAADANDDRISRELIEDNAGWADNDRDSYLVGLEGIARDLLQANWLWVEAVARALMERKTISTADIIGLRQIK